MELGNANPGGLTQAIFSTLCLVLVLISSVGHWGFPGSSVVKTNLPAVQVMQEMWVPSLDWEDLLEEEMATHSSILAWGIPWTEDRGGLQSMGLQKRLT